MGELKEYFDGLEKGVGECYRVAREARRKGLDPVGDVESPLALTMAERAVNLVKTVYPKLSVSKVSSRILELEDMYGKLDSTVSFVIAREIAEGNFGKFGGELGGIDCGLRVGFAYMTLGVVASPIEGYTGIEKGVRNKGGDVENSGFYLRVKFSGPIRSAGTTSVCLFLMLVDYLRSCFGFGLYDATEEEVGRYVSEIGDFHNKVANLAYFPTEEEVRFLALGLPVQIDGDATERIEVSSFKDLARVETNRIRGGMCLAFGESLALKAGKALGRLKGVRSNLGEVSCGWDYLEDYVVLHKKRDSGTEKVEATYIKDLVAGRPVYGHPGRSGGFRFRYGRSRTSGFSGVSIHPATMGVTGGFLSHGTQLRLEKPSKACVITSCDSIDGPIVKLRNGSVRRVLDYEEGLRLYKDSEIVEILYLGDLLFPVGDVIDRNADLVRPGYVEEWWEREVEGLKSKVENVSVEASTSALSCGSLEDAVKVSKDLGVSLHPDYIFYWSQISSKEFVGLLKWLNTGVWRGDKLVLNWDSGKRELFGQGKRALELLGVEHEVVLDNIVLDKDARALLFNLGKEEVYNGEKLVFRFNETDKRDVFEIVNSLCSLDVRDKAGEFVGARMGRPEKAKARKLVGSPNVLFPVGDQGGRMKSVQDAVELGVVKSNFPCFRCDCGNEGIFERCEVCGKDSRRVGYCRKCGEVKEGRCEVHGDIEMTWNRKVEVKRYFDSAVEKLGLGEGEVPVMVKGVGVLTSKDKVSEDLAKGFLRAKYNLSVNKDGTVRYDAIEVPLTHFRAREIGAGVDKLRGLGYLKDVNGKDLVSDSQVLELMPHDIVLPGAAVLGEDRADKVFFNLASFVDEELERFYGLERFYNLKGREDLVGVSVVCMAPHNCAGVVGRVIGFSEVQGLLASPFMHAAMRRDCDGDEASVMLLMDVLLNFSKRFLPNHRGASQDAPLVLNSRISAGEVDDQILFFETCGGYPLAFYEAASRGEHSSEIKNVVELVGDKLKDGKGGFVGNGFTHDTKDFNFGNNNGVYKTIPTMKEKVDEQMRLAEILRSTDEDDVARLVLERHFIRDIRGNLRKFCRQSFRCSSCSASYRRPPLSGVCHKCSGKLIFTVSEGSVRKYVEPAMELMGKYKISSYTKESMELLSEYIERIFGKGDEQTTL